jgi:zinc transport system substrate-binding protein
LEDIVANYPNLTIVDASEGITMLQNEDHEDSDDEHADEEDADEEDANDEDAEDKEPVYELDEDNQEEYEQEETDQIEAELEEGDHEDESVEGEDDHHDHGEYNPHVWLNPKLYIEQIENVRVGLKNYINSQDNIHDIDPDKLVLLIDQNAQSYIQKVMDLDSELDKSLTSISQSPDQSVSAEQAVIFHDSFAYFADRIGMTVAFTVPLDSDTALSAYDIKEIIDEVREENIKYLFTEQQYSDSIAKRIEAETEAKLYIIDSIVTGNGSMDSYLEGMRNNIEIIKAAMK